MMVFKSLRQIRPNWLVLWDKQHNSYRNEPFSFGFEFNYLIDELESVPDQLGITQKQLELLAILFGPTPSAPRYSRNKSLLY